MGGVAYSRLVKWEMSYQVDYPAVLKALFIPFDPVMIMIFIGYPLGLLVLFLFRKKTGDQLGYLWVVLLLSALVPILLIMGMSWAEAGSGWRLEKGKLILRASVSATLDPVETRVALVESSGPWRPVRKNNGYGTPGLSTGWFRLKNGEKAVVFRHLNSPQMVVMEYNDRYYVVSHPGVEELYQQLVDLGAHKLGPGY